MSSSERSSSAFVKRGLLLKQGRVVKNWKERLFVLYPNKLVYFARDDLTTPRGVIRLPDVTHITTLPGKGAFQITTSTGSSTESTDRDYNLEAESDEERSSWIQAIQRVLFAPTRQAEAMKQLVELQSDARLCTRGVEVVKSLLLSGMDGDLEAGLDLMRRAASLQDSDRCSDAIESGLVDFEISKTEKQLLNAFAYLKSVFEKEEPTANARQRLVEIGMVHYSAGLARDPGAVVTGNPLLRNADPHRWTPAVETAFGTVLHAVAVRVTRSATQRSRMRYEARIAQEFRVCECGAMRTIVLPQSNTGGEPFSNLKCDDLVSTNPVLNENGTFRETGDASSPHHHVHVLTPGHPYFRSLELNTENIYAEDSVIFQSSDDEDDDTIVTLPSSELNSQHSPHNVAEAYSSVSNSSEKSSANPELGSKVDSNSTSATPSVRIRKPNKAYAQKNTPVVTSVCKSCGSATKIPITPQMSPVSPPLKSDNTSTPISPVSTPLIDVEKRMELSRSTSITNIRAEGAFRDHYELGDKLGEGAYSVVYRAIHHSTGRARAVKVALKARMTEPEQKRLLEEVRIMQLLDHPNIVKLHAFFEDSEAFYIVSELMTGGELFDSIVRKTFYSESEARDVVRTIAEAVSYMHSMGIAHRDLKPENILLSSPDVSTAIIKIADLGFARKVPSLGLQTACGTPSYVAPEILRGEKYGVSADLWSLGVIAYILLAGYAPFSSPNQIDLFRAIVAGRFAFDAPYWDKVSDNAKDLVRSLLVTDPAKRISAQDVLKHPWLHGLVSRQELSAALGRLRAFNVGRRAHVRCGVLRKQGLFFRNWKTRFFVLTNETLEYYDEAEYRACETEKERERERGIREKMEKNRTLESAEISIQNFINNNNNPAAANGAAANNRPVESSVGRLLKIPTTVGPEMALPAVAVASGASANTVLQLADRDGEKDVLRQGGRPTHGIGEDSHKHHSKFYGNGSEGKEVDRKNDADQRMRAGSFTPLDRLFGVSGAGAVRPKGVINLKDVVNIVPIIKDTNLIVSALEAAKSDGYAISTTNPGLNAAVKEKEKDSSGSGSSNINSDSNSNTSLTGKTKVSMSHCDGEGLMHRLPVLPSTFGPFLFKITTVSGRVFVLHSDSSVSRAEWIRAISVAKQHGDLLRKAMVALQGENLPQAVHLVKLANQWNDAMAQNTNSVNNVPNSNRNDKIRIPGNAQPAPAAAAPISANNHPVNHENHSRNRSKSSGPLRDTHTHYTSIEASTREEKNDGAPASNTGTSSPVIHSPKGRERSTTMPARPSPMLSSVNNSQPPIAITAPQPPPHNHYQQRVHNIDEDDLNDFEISKSNLDTQFGPNTNTATNSTNVAISNTNGGYVSRGGASLRRQWTLACDSQLDFLGKK